MPGARRVVAVVGLATVLAALLAGCGDDGPSTTAAGPSTTAPGRTDPASDTTPGAATTGPGAAPTDVPDTLRFTAAGLDGAQVVGADYAGRDVALWFWAPW